MYKNNNFPKTRYQGSKLKLLPWIQDNIVNLDFNSVLDAFSGTGSVSYMFKCLDKQIYSNDIMPFNYFTSKALIENNSILLDPSDINLLLTKDNNFEYSNFIEKTFNEIYYTQDENIWLDIVIQNILKLKNEYKKAIAFWALFQCCIIKRPYNLFHRKNLHIRMADVERSFGNKSTWDKPFEHFFRKFIEEANLSIFDNNKSNISTCCDILKLEKIDFDLIYLDPPYIPQSGSLTLYQDFYHFLIGVSDYYNWQEKIDYKSKNLKLISNYSIWEDKKNILKGFVDLFQKFQSSKFVISYRDDGIPSIDEIVNELKKINKKVFVKYVDYKYALSNKSSREALIIAI